MRLCVSCPSRRNQQQYWMMFGEVFLAKKRKRKCNRIFVFVLKRGLVGPRGPAGPPGAAGVPGVDGIDVSRCLVRINVSIQMWVEAADSVPVRVNRLSDAGFYWLTRWEKKQQQFEL